MIFLRKFLSSLKNRVFEIWSPSLKKVGLYKPHALEQEKNPKHTKQKES